MKRLVSAQRTRMRAGLRSSLAWTLALAAAALDAAEIRSPDGQVAITFDVKDLGADRGVMVYGVSYKGRPIIADARLGLAFEGAPPLEKGLRIARVERTRRAATYRPVYGERSLIRDRYEQLAADLEERAAPRRRLRLTFRAYDEGAAFRYTIPAQEGLDEVTVAREMTRFRFASDAMAYAVYSAQGRYERVPLGRVRRGCERPLTMEIPGGPVLSVAEARLVDYARMRLSPAGEPLTLTAELGSAVRARLPLTTPWRVVILADRPAELLERNDIIRNLNDPCAIEDPSWIEPGKVIREVTLTTAGGMACVEFAAAHNLQYVEFDAGWYGPENDGAADARTVRLDPRRSKGPLDLPAVIAHAKTRGIGIILYVNRRALERQLDEILPLYASWGVKGVKFGFVQVGSQRATAWLHEAVRKAAAHRLMVDVHDEYRPTGYSRTYPNLMTQEGIRGNECMPAASENLVLPFTRMLAGAADYTVCYYTPRIKTTHAHQLAASVVFYSPWQFLFWYDRPSAYRGEPEIEFFERIPTVWDETRVIHGEIGRFITVARRSGEAWFVGSMTDESPRELAIPLAFLEPNRPYAASIYADAGPEQPGRTKVRIERRIVDATAVVAARMAASGGHAMWIRPAARRDGEAPRGGGGG